jgi:glycosyltransferase involved in cell wall biosynthesis
MRYYGVKSKKIRVIDLNPLIKSDFKIDESESIDIKKTLEIQELGNIKFGIIGAWNRTENSSGFQKFLKLCKKHQVKNLNLTISGSNINIIKEMDLEDHKVNILGYVDDITYFFSQIDILLVPLELGGGIKIKVLQALANNTPCLGTEVAFEGVLQNKSSLKFDDIDSMVKYLGSI